MLKRSLLTVLNNSRQAAGQPPSRGGQTGLPVFRGKFIKMLNEYERTGAGLRPEALFGLSGLRDIGCIKAASLPICVESTTDGHPPSQ